MFIGRLQDLYINLMSPWIPFVSRIPVRWRRRMITFCFFVIIVLFLIVRFVMRSDSYFDHQLLGILMMSVIGILSLGTELKRVSWSRPVFLVWMCLCLVMTISDFLVPRDFCGFGVVLFLVFPGVFFIWQNHPEREWLWGSFKTAVRIAFFLMTVLSFGFRPLYEGGRYSGVFTNPNMFGLYLILVMAVFFSDLDRAVLTGKRWYKSVPSMIGLGVASFFLLKTQSRTSFVACGVIAVGWLLIQLTRLSDRRTGISFLKNLLATVLIGVALYPVCLVTTAYLPWVIGHPVVFAGESLYLNNEVMITDFGKHAIEPPKADLSGILYGYVPAAVVSETEKPDTSEPKQESSPPAVQEGGKDGSEQKSEEPQSRFWSMLENSSSLNALFNWRLDIYRGYVERIDFVGHPEIALTVNGKRRAHAHNNWIQYGYTYGWFGMLFYGLITVFAVFRSILYFRRHAAEKSGYVFLVSAVCIGFVVATITECLMLPFEVFPAFGFWFVFGELFIAERKETKRV